MLSAAPFSSSPPFPFSVTATSPHERPMSDVSSIGSKCTPFFSNSLCLDSFLRWSHSGVQLSSCWEAGGRGLGLTQNRPTVCLEKQQPQEEKDNPGWCEMCGKEDSSLHVHTYKLHLTALSFILSTPEDSQRASSTRRALQAVNGISAVYHLQEHGTEGPLEERQPVGVCGGRAGDHGDPFKCLSPLGFPLCSQPYNLQRGETC